MMATSPAGRGRPDQRSGSGPTQAAILRPLLESSHAELLDYLRALGQGWREDSSNRDPAHARNRIRHQVLPLLEREQPGLKRVLASMAETARAEEDYWEQQVERLRPEVAPGAGIIRLKPLAQQPPALQRRLVRAAAEAQGLRLESQHVRQVLEFAFPAEARGGRTLELPGGGWARRERDQLRFEPEAAAAGLRPASNGYNRGLRPRAARAREH